MQAEAAPVAAVPNPQVMGLLVPHASSRPLQILTNFFVVKFGASVHQYSVTIESPEPPTADQLREFVSTHLFKNPEHLKLLTDTLGQSWVYLNNVVYSTFTHLEPLNFPVSLDKGAVGNIQIVFQKKLDAVGDADVLVNLFGRLVKNLIRRVGLKQIGRKMFDPSKAVPNQGFELWPGFSTAFMGSKDNLMLNVDMCTKVIRQETVLMAMENIQRMSRGNAFEQELQEKLSGKPVMTRYNRRFYTIKGFKLNMNAMSTFKGSDGVDITFAEYYQKKYNVKINATGAPLILSEDKKSRGEVFLIPELCQMTGLNDAERANRGLMSSLDSEMKPEAGSRLLKSMRLLDVIEQNPKTQPTIKDWKIGLLRQPTPVQGKQLEIGALTFGQNATVFPERTQNLDREMQKPIQSVGRYRLQGLVVLFAEECRAEFQTFFNMIPAVLRPLNMEFTNVHQVEINQYGNFNNVKQALQTSVTPTTSACVIIIPGRKKQGRYYDEIKRYMLSSIPVPSQVVLATTMNGKNIQSIVNKIFVQICAKVGGIPWAINDLPFAAAAPTIVMAFNNYTRPGKPFGLYTMMASMNNTLTVYLPKMAEGRGDYTMPNFVRQYTEVSLNEFGTANGASKDKKVLPRFIIVYREGVSKGQQKKGILDEIQAMKEAMAVVYKDQPVEPRLIYVVLSKTSNVKFYFDPTNAQRPENLANPPPGTYVGDKITSDPNEFFLNSQRPTKGLLAPIGYCILENQLTEIDKIPLELVKEVVAKLTNKLCYLYYNTSNPIKVPAPVHLAIRLAFFVTEHSAPNQKMVIHQHLENIWSSYYI